MNTGRYGAGRKDYLKATAILPKKLILEIQKYVQEETIYIPKSKTSHQRRGTHSGTRKLIDERNASINGRTINQIADEYHLSIETIKKLSTLNE
ncbi:CD3324 family protein [Bacillus luti]|uniref:CD3324 family protein n=1 Tax=Bacillus luti TaxID=2026191 RepID=UPI003D088EBA